MKKQSFETLPSSVFAESWGQLYNAFGERMQDEEMRLMDAIIESVMIDEQERIKLISEEYHAPN